MNDVLGIRCYTFPVFIDCGNNLTWPCSQEPHQLIVFWGSWIQFTFSPCYPKILPCRRTRVPSGPTPWDFREMFVLRLFLRDMSRLTGHALHSGLFLAVKWSIGGAYDDDDNARSQEVTAGDTVLLRSVCNCKNREGLFVPNRPVVNLTSAVGLCW
jgi:hypothetical protein